jgi:integrase
MNIHTPQSLPDAAAFSDTRPISLAEVVALARAGLDGTARRDTLSAFNVLAEKGKVDLSANAATAAAVRKVLASLSGASLGVTSKRFANVRSLITKAVERFGSKRFRITQKIPPDCHWQALLDAIPRLAYRWSLSRLACYCTVKGVRPEAIGPETLLGLHDALEAECLSQAPRNLLKHTIAIWNWCQRNVAGWPPITLSSPFKTEPNMLPLSAFPESFRSDVAAWEKRMTDPDPLDLDAPLHPLRAATLDSYRLTFRRLASALVRGGRLEVDRITGLAILCEVDNLTEGLRPYLPTKGSDRDHGYVHKMATQMRNLAKHHLKLPSARVDAITVLVGRLAPKSGRAMGRRNRTRLSQFDDAAVVQRLLRFPEEEFARAMGIGNLVRRAKSVERALAISVLIFTGVRVKNLRNLRLDHNVVRRGDRVFLNFVDDEMKSGNALELELSDETIKLLDTFLNHHRDRLAGADGPYLFPGPNGAARSYSAMRDAVSKPLRRHAGIELSPHLYRHIIAKIIAERAPEMLPDVSRMLGHKSFDTTYRAYLGTETPAASRRINKLLQATRANPKLGDKR